MSKNKILTFVQKYTMIIALVLVTLFFAWRTEGMTPEGKVKGSFVLKEKPTFAEQAALMGIELPIYPES